MKPTEELKAEHDAILTMVKIMAKLLASAKKGNGTRIKHMREILTFFKIFVDKCHHGKEENFLFPAFEAAGIPNEDGLIGAMLAEHQLGREIVSEMTRQLDLIENQGKPDFSQFSDAAERYATLIRSHIEKENQVLFPMGDSKMTVKERKKISEDFMKWEKEEIGEQQHEKFHRQMENLKSIYVS